MKRTSENHTGSEDLDQPFGIEMRCVMKLLALLYGNMVNVNVSFNGVHGLVSGYVKV